MNPEDKHRVIEEYEDRYEFNLSVGAPLDWCDHAKLYSSFGWEQKQEDAWAIITEAHEKLTDLGWLVVTSRKREPVSPPRDYYRDKRTRELDTRIKEFGAKEGIRQHTEALKQKEAE
jgi:hypothetical protein